MFLKFFRDLLSMSFKVVNEKPFPMLDIPAPTGDPKSPDQD